MGVCKVKRLWWQRLQTRPSLRQRRATPDGAMRRYCLCLSMCTSMCILRRYEPGQWTDSQAIGGCPVLARGRTLITSYMISYTHSPSSIMGYTQRADKVHPERIRLPGSPARSNFAPLEATSLRQAAGHPLFWKFGASLRKTSSSICSGLGEVGGPRSSSSMTTQPKIHLVGISLRKGITGIRHRFDAVKYHFGKENKRTIDYVYRLQY